MNPHKTHLKIGTRGSRLALWQAEWVKAALEAEHPGLSVALEIIKTKGDKILDVPLAAVGGKGLFVKEIETALMEGGIDLAVHSMKDMPAEIPLGLCIDAVPLRESPADVLISKNGDTFLDLKPGARIGTASLRRGAQLLYARGDVEIVSLRGNLDTRLKKLESEGLDAIVLAAAGVIRLGLKERISEYLDPEIMLPAVGQGALCIEIRANDPAVSQLLMPLDHPDTHVAIIAERSFLRRLEGGCQVPMAAYAQVEDGNTLSISGLVADISGRPLIKDALSGLRGNAEKIGLSLAERLLAAGAGEILEKLKET